MMDDEERQAMNASANFHSALGNPAFEQGWEAAKRYFLNRPDAIETLGALLRADMQTLQQGTRVHLFGPEDQQG